LQQPPSCRLLTIAVCLDAGEAIALITIDVQALSCASPPHEAPRPGTSYFL